MTFAQTLKYLRKRKKITQEELAGKLGLERSSIGKYESSGAVPSLEVLNGMAEFFRVSTDYLLGRTDSPAGFDNIFPVTKKRIPYLGEISCGKPVFAREEHDCYVAAGDDIEADFCLRATGDSMIGARILDGDLVFIKASPMVDNGEIAAVIIGDEATLKRVYYYKEQNKLFLIAENPKYPPLAYTGPELDEIRILGKAVAFQSAVR